MYSGEHNFYLLRTTDAGLASDGGLAFEYPPSSLLDGDERSAFSRSLEASAYNGVSEFIKYVKPPNPTAQSVDLSRGVGLGEQILDAQEHIIGMSKRHYEAFSDDFHGSLDCLHPVHLYRSPGQRSGKIKPKDYWLGTIRHRETIASWLDFSGSTFDLVDYSGFHRHGTRAMRGEVEFGSAFDLIESGCRFADLADYKDADRTAGNDKFAIYVPRNLSLLQREVPAIFQLKLGQILLHERIAMALTSYRKPGSTCPYPPVIVQTAN